MIHYQKYCQRWWHFIQLPPKDKSRQISKWKQANTVVEFWGHLIWATKFNKDRKRKINVLHENKKLQSVTLFGKLNIESEDIIIVNGTKSEIYTAQ